MNSQARARSLGFLGSHFEKSEWFTTDLIGCLVKMVIREKTMVKMVIKVTTIGDGATSWRRGGEEGL